MFCPACHAENADSAEACFTCGRALHTLTQGVLLNQRYEILRPLGSGGMGRVYKAHDRVLDEHVAIKVLRSELVSEPDAARRFRSEIKLARRVSHRNVCRIHEYGEDGGLAFISMEFIDGENLREYLAERALSAEEALELSIQVAEGVQAVHEHGIVHRDFKASNIMIDRKGVAKLMDFGIAKHAAGEAISQTGSGVVGTPEYMSPEQVTGARLDLRSDLYSLGCVVFETFAGAPPFRGATPLETMRLHEREAPPLESASLPEPVRAILRRALAKSPAQRFAGAADFVQALRQARGQLGVAGPRAGLPPDSQPDLPPPTHTVARVPASGAPPSGRPLAAVPALIGVLALAIGLLAVRSWRAARAPGAAAPSAEPVESTAPHSLPESEPSAPLPPASPPPGIATPSPSASARPDSPPASASQVPATPPAVAPRPPPEPAAGGTLLLLIVPESEVTIDGDSIGAVSSREVALAAGPHAVLILHPDYKPLPRKVTIVPGVVTRLIVDLEEKGIRQQP